MLVASRSYLLITDSAHRSLLNPSTLVSAKASISHAVYGRPRHSPNPFDRARLVSEGRQKKQQCGSAGCASTRCQQRAQVVVTREAGKNGKLKSALQKEGIIVLELPLVETSRGPEKDQLAAQLKASAFDWIVITSPEAANVFLQGWAEAERPEVRVAVVGQGTGQVIQAKGDPLLHVDYTPPKANAVSLASGLPHIDGGNNCVLYPSSAKAGSDLQIGLQKRGFEVSRLNTYDTRPVSQVQDTKLKQACQADVVAFASPSAVKAWQKIMSGQDVAGIAFACIGSTTAIFAEKQGLEHVHFPQQPGIDGFVSAILEALDGVKGRLVSAHTA